MRAPGVWLIECKPSPHLHWVLGDQVGSFPYEASPLPPRDGFHGAPWIEEVCAMSNNRKRKDPE